MTTTVPLIVSLALRVALLGGIALCVRSLRRNASASECHLIWMLAIGSMLLLPVATRLLPTLELVALPASPTPTPSISVEGLRASEMNWGMIFGLTWLGGSLVFLISLIAAHGRARRIVRSAVHNAAWSRAIGRTVAISEDSAVAFNYGLRSPVIVLPAAATQWPHQLLHAALVHEAAHIARRDGLSLLVSQLARVVYWWHPAVWFATREAAAERERACDDAVLRDGIRASEYGEHLLIAGTRRRAMPIRLAAPLFSHSDGLARRISSLLDDRVDRRPVRCGTAYASLAIALPFLAVTASATLIARPISTAIATLSLPPMIAQAPAGAPVSAPSKPDQNKQTTTRRRKRTASGTRDTTPRDDLEKQLAEGTWIVDGRVVDAASFPVDLKQMARLARDMGRLAGKMIVTIDSAKMRPTR